jgi:hypothetical protein
VSAYTYGGAALGFSVVKRTASAVGWTFGDGVGEGVGDGVGDGDGTIVMS